MKIKCDYCNNYINDTDEKCPSCGSPNAHLARTATSTPSTIAELAQWYCDHHLPPYETTRFFIGIDCKEPRAFGIYEENGQFIVYKNKDDNTRAIRYQGTDEAYAVNELYLKLKSEILNQKSRQGGTVTRSNGSSKGKFRKFMENSGIVVGGSLLMILAVMAWSYKPLLFTLTLLIPFVALVVIASIGLGNSKPKLVSKLWIVYGLLALVFTLVLGGLAISKSGTVYYRYDDTVYCYYDYDYYEYDSSYSDYYPVSYSNLPSELRDNMVDYEYDAGDITWDDSYTIENSSYYSEHLESSSDDSSYDWGSGSSWDSGSTDWGSDW